MLDKYLLPEQEIIGRIQVIQDQKVMLDFDLALLYEIPTRRINEQVKRNLERFPEDFMFQLTEKEWQDLRSQIATANHEKRRNHPYAFTEHGVLMLSSVLSNQKAIQINIQLVRIFTKMRDMLLGQKSLIDQLEKLANRIDHHDNKLDGVVNYLKRFVLDKKVERKEVGYKN
ncbi:MAG: ORF6N domain-containing protein [Bacteroidota bacterium]